MKAVLRTIRILVVTLLITHIRCQDGYSNQDLLRFQQMANEGPVETITSYSTNIIQRDPSSQSISSVSVQYHMTDDTDKNEDYNRADRGRSRKVFRIKNPFQRQEEDNGHLQNSNTEPQDSDTGSSNQYASMQYSLPPEEFLQQMRAEHQYYQPQQQQQASTSAPNLGYTATPQPQYQYSTIAASGYDNSNQQSNQISQLEPKLSNPQSYRSFSNSYQYGGQNGYALDSSQSTPSPVPPYLSTANNQYVGTQSNSYVSSSSPMYLTSPSNLQQYVSSSMTAVQAGTPDYSNKVTSTMGSNNINYERNDPNKKMLIDHYDNSANGVRYPINLQQQFQNEYPSSTVAPSSSPYSDALRDSWQSATNGGVNAHYSKYSYNTNSQENRADTNSENANSDTHRIGNFPSANNVYLNFVQPDFQALANLRSRTRDMEHDTSQPDYYSHGEYGWKLNDKKPSVSQNAYSSNNYPRYQTYSPQSDNVAVSQMSFHMDTGKPSNYEQISKSSPDNTDAQEFAKAAAKAHESLKRQQMYANEYAVNYNANKQLNGPSSSGNFYSTNEKQRNNIFSDTSTPNPYIYNPQSDLITAPPYYSYTHARENQDEKAKQPFDHDKALKSIVSIDVSNVASNLENQQKALESSNRYNIQNYKDQVEKNMKQNYKAITDSFYQDKNALYGLNIKSQSEDNVAPDSYKLLETNAGIYNKQPTPEQAYNQASYSENKRYVEGPSPSLNFVSQSPNTYQDSIQSSANIQQQGFQRPQNQLPTDITSILKVNDIPYRLSQNLPSETFRLSNNNNFEQLGLPTPLPIRLNQNVASHQLDVSTNILNKLLMSKQPTLNRPEFDPQLLSTINGFKVANPFNVDLRLVTEMLKGKTATDESQTVGLRDQFNKPTLKLDISQLQQLLSSQQNTGNLLSLNEGLTSYGSPYLDVYNSGRYPYQGVKYSRSQEEEESIIPIADSSNTHPIGAVIEQDDTMNSHELSSGTDLTAQDDDPFGDSTGLEKDKHKIKNPVNRGTNKRPRPQNSLLSSRHSYQRKYPKDISEPYPLLKPPPKSPNSSKNHLKMQDKYSRRRRVRRPRVYRVMKTEPLFEAENDEDEKSEVPTLLIPPPPDADEKSDIIRNDDSS